jgi:hypothetical protein
LKLNLIFLQKSNNMFKNWKTSLFGLGAVISGIATAIKGDIPGGVSAIIGGVGLFAAKDSEVNLNKRK